MRVKFMVTEADKRTYESYTTDVYSKISYMEYWKRGIFFHPSEPHEAAWLWMVGHEKSVPEKLHLNRMWTNRWVMHICVKGKGYYNGFEIGPGSAWICWPGNIHTMSADPADPFEYYWFMLRGKDMLALCKNNGFRSSELIFKCSYSGVIVPLLEACLNTDFNINSVNLVEYNNSLMRLILSLNKNADVEIIGYESEIYKNYVESAKNILQDNNYSLTVAQLSDMLGITANHFYRLFAGVTEESPKEYILRKRLELGTEMLKSGMTPTATAAALKYVDYSSFYRTFKKYYGVSPKDYR